MTMGLLRTIHSLVEPWLRDGRLLAGMWLRLRPTGLLAGVWQVRTLSRGCIEIRTPARGEWRARTTIHAGGDLITAIDPAHATDLALARIHRTRVARAILPLEQFRAFLRSLGRIAVALTALVPIRAVVGDPWTTLRWYVGGALALLTFRLVLALIFRVAVRRLLAA